MHPRVGSARLPVVALAFSVLGPALLVVGVMWGFAELIGPEPDVVRWYVLALVGVAADVAGLILAIVAVRRRRLWGIAVLALVVDVALTAAIAGVVLLVWFA